MSKRNVYKGHRYVPKIMGEWNQEETYEGLSIVTNKGTSYTSKKRVPVGIDILDEEYWVVTGNYNAQVENYRQEVREFDHRISENTLDINTNKLNIEKTTAQMTQKNTYITPQEFGAVGDGVVDDTAAIQTLIVHAIQNKRNIKANKKDIYKITKTILIPQQSIFNETYDFDFGNATFLLATDTTLFESGYFNGEILLSNFGTPLDSHMSFGIRLHSFRIESSVGLLLSTAIKIQDWHQSSYIGNIKSNVTHTVFHGSNNYYLQHVGIETILDGEGLQPRFIFDYSHNLCNFERLMGANTPIIYQFNGGLTACKMIDVSFEGGVIGAEFNSQVYDMEVNNAYVENIQDVAFKFNSYINNFLLTGSYINFVEQPNMFLIDYQPLPHNNIVIDSTNNFESMTGEEKLFKTIDNTLGYNLFTFRKKVKNAEGISDLLVNNNNFSTQGNIEQILNLGSAKANLVNEFVVGNYSGRFTSGYDRLIGGVITSYGTNFDMRTSITFSPTQIIYINIQTEGKGLFYAKGFFIGTLYFEISETGILPSSKMEIINVDGFNLIRSKAMGNTEPITRVLGEVRLI